jgi:hypothetical protein
MLRYNRVATDVFMDTFFSSKKTGPTTRGYTCCQIFCTEFGHVFVVMMESKAGSNIAFALKKYFKTVGVPPMIIADAAREQIQGDALLLCNEAGCQIYQLEKDTPSANRAERYIKMLKDEAKADLVKSNSPLVFWDYCVERRAKIINSVARNNLHLQGQVPEMKMTGRPHDISNLCEFNWYEWCKYRSEGRKFPSPSERLGRILGPAEHASHAMSQWVLTDNGMVLPIQTCRPLTDAEYNSPVERQRMADFDSFIKKRFGDSASPPPEEPISDPTEKEFDYYEDGEPGSQAAAMPEAEDVGDLDNYLNAEVLLPQNGEHMQAARVVRRVTGPDGDVKGRYHPNSILNSHMYEVIFPDGAKEQYAANVIAENIFSQVDEEGHRYQWLDYISDHRKNGNAVERADGYIVTSTGRKKPKQTT